MKNADWAWLAAALIISFLTNFRDRGLAHGHGPDPAATGSHRRASSCRCRSRTSRCRPWAGWRRRSASSRSRESTSPRPSRPVGCSRTSATSSPAALLFIVAVALSPTTIRTGDIPVDEVVQILILIVVLLVIATVLIFKVPKLRKMVLPPVQIRDDDDGHALRSPRRVVELLGGNMINVFMYATVMLFCLYAFGATSTSGRCSRSTSSSAPWPHSYPSRVGELRCRPSACRALSPRRSPDRDRGRCGARQPARRQLHPGGPGLVRDEQPAPRRLPLTRPRTRVGDRAGIRG